MKKITLATTLAFLAAPAVQADTLLGLFAGAGSWKSDYQGTAGNPSITLKELGVKEQTNTYYYVALEHPIPLVPNILLEHTDVSSTQSAVVSQSFTIDGTSFTANDTIASDFDLTHTDFTLYYELLDNWVNVDLGITARKFDGYVQAQSQNNPADNKKVAVDQTLPLIYAKAEFELPFTGFFAGGDIKYVSYSGDKLTDYTVKVGYLFDSVLDIGVEGGYRKMSLTVDDDDLKADIDLKGPYLAVIAHF